MICLYDNPESIEKPKDTASVRYCRFDGEDAKIPDILADHPQAKSLIHLILEGYIVAEASEKESYWRESTEAIIDWMMKKGIVETVS